MFNLRFPLFLMVVMFFFTGCKETTPRELLPEVDVRPIDLIEIDWSPDMKMFVGVKLLHHSSEIYIWEPDNMMYEKLTPDESFSYNSKPDWHPNLNKIVYYSSNEFGKDFSIGILDLDTGDKTPIGYGTSPEWLPNGQQVVYIQKHSKIVVTEVNGVNSRIIWDPPIETGDLVNVISVSPDGKKIAVLIDIKSPPLNDRVYVIDVNKDLEVINEHLVFTGHVNPYLQWSWDSQWIIVNYDGLVAIRIDPICISDVLIMHDSLKSTTSSELNWSNDGNYLAISQIWESRRWLFFLEAEDKIIQNWLSSGNCR